MAKQLNYKVSEYNNTLGVHEVIARFEHTSDAMKFAEAVTLSGDRKVVVEDKTGWVTLWYADGFTTSIR